MTNRVFVVQQPATFSQSLRRFVPKYDLSPARDFGKLVFILGPGNIFRERLAQSVIHIQNVMGDFKPGDYLLAIGDPVAIAAASMVASFKTGGAVKLLKWDRHASRYHCFPIDLNSEG